MTSLHGIAKDVISLLISKHNHYTIVLLQIFDIIAINDQFQDDMIDDVMSFVKIAEVLKDRGAYKVYVMATHGLLSSDAPRQIEESCIDKVRWPQSLRHGHPRSAVL